jgi:hypothetical protein
MPIPVGTCVAVLTTHDAGWIKLVHEDEHHHDVDCWYAQCVQTHPENVLERLTPGRSLKRTFLQGPFVVKIKASIVNGIPVYSARAGRLGEDRSPPARWTKIR